MNTFQTGSVTRCLNHPERLSDWEMGFLNSLVDTKPENIPEHRLTPNQNHKLNQIAQKVEFGRYTS